MTAVTDEYAITRVDAMLLQSLDFSEETRNVDHAAGADEIHAAFGKNARR